MYYIGEISEGEYGKKIIKLWDGIPYFSRKEGEKQIKKIKSDHNELELIPENIISEFEDWE